MPIPAFCVDQPAAICCETMFTVVEEALDIAATAVRNCFGERCGEIAAFVCHGEPIGGGTTTGGGDYVAAWLASINPPITEFGKMYFGPTVRLNINIAVNLGGYPSIRIIGGEIAAVPSAVEQMQASYFSYGAMEAMYRAVVAELHSKPGARLGGCNVAGISQLIPHTVADGAARWMMQVFVDMDV